MKRYLIIIWNLIVAFNIMAQDMQMETYCNPLNIDYTYMVYNSDQNLSYRSGADPATVKFKGEYYMFVTRSMGYWHSSDLQNWSFITPERWYFQGSNAPAAFNYKDSVLYVMGDPSGQMSILYTDDPKKGDWKATPSILTDLQDPAFFIDDDDSAYIYWGSSNTFPIKGRMLKKNKRFIACDSVYELFNSDEQKHGWERFGENHSDTVIKGYKEGPWMTKYKGKYYLQYAAPGTEFNVYADGVYIADNPLGPYAYQKHNPFSYKPGGFMNGAGHGSTVIGPGGKYWHFASMSLSVNVNWERRLCMFPLFFDQDGIMYTNTRFGDYPHYAPAFPGEGGAFRGWMLLSYNKNVEVSSSVDDLTGHSLVDENVKTYWLAQSNDAKQWVKIDLDEVFVVNAVQVNYFDHKSNMYGRIPELYHRYTIEGSQDGITWQIIVDRSVSFKDTPNDYVELSTPVNVRYIRYNNIKVPTPNLAISDIRVFGKGSGKQPARLKKVTVERHNDKRDVTIQWEKNDNCQGYNVLWGIAPDKLYSSWMVYADNKLLLKSLNKDQDYYFTVEAFNENGVSEISKIIHSPALQP